MCPCTGMSVSYVGEAMGNMSQVMHLSSNVSFFFNLEGAAYRQHHRGAAIYFSMSPPPFCLWTCASSASLSFSLSLSLSRSLPLALSLWLSLSISISLGERERGARVGTRTRAPTKPQNPNLNPKRRRLGVSGSGHTLAVHSLLCRSLTCNLKTRRAF
jgi:hypothetical protein